LPRATSVLIVAGLLLVSRRLATRRILGHVDWHLLALFAGLFVVTQALAATALPQALLRDLVAAGLTPDRTAVLAPIALVGSNVIGNVPAVVLLLSILPPLPEGVLYGLALLTTLAGNLLIVGSIANIIVVERARASGVELGFLAHARSGVPMTLISLAAAAAWLVAGGWMAW
jgi:Na+/H+ antiporter NhaD/arsenite permease-like protein